MKTPGVEQFSKRLDEIFDQGMPTKAQIIDAFNKSAESPVLPEITDIVEKFIKAELPDANSPFHYQAEIAVGLRDFAKWYRSQI
jgi:hypothetical protein